MRRLTSMSLGLAMMAGSISIAHTADAQRAGNPRAAARREARAEAQKEKAEAKDENRQERLAAQVRDRFQAVARQRLGLNDDQARRLKEVDDRYETQRNDVAKQEREARANLRTALSTNGGDQSKIDANMSTITNAQKRRAEILESEQKDLGVFLTPKQRVQYFSLHDNLARRIQAMRQNQGSDGKPVPDVDQPDR